MYEYTKIESNSKEYLDDIEKIEELKEKIDFKKLDLTPFIKTEIYNSSKIENNSFSYSEYEKLIDEGLSIRGKTLSEHLQLLNLKDAFILLKMSLNKKFEINEDFIKWTHGIITKGELPLEESGKYRNQPEHISVTSYIPPIETFVPSFMEELCNEYKRELNLETQFERICEFKRNFERIHPFSDGNGRTGRFLMNVMLLQNNYLPITIEENERQEYFDSIENNTFCEFAAKKEIKALEQFLERNIEYDR